MIWSLDRYCHIFSPYSLLQNLLNVDTNRDGMEFCTVGTGVLDGPSVTGVPDGPFSTPFTHSIIWIGLAWSHNSRPIDHRKSRLIDECIYLRFVRIWLIRFADRRGRRSLQRARGYTFSLSCISWETRLNFDYSPHPSIEYFCDFSTHPLSSPIPL